MNAVTSVARDTRERATRWRLEELGGQIAFMEPPEPAQNDGAEESIAQLGNFALSNFTTA
jgi:hypothetical protein